MYYWFAFWLLAINKDLFVTKLKLIENTKQKLQITSTSAFGLLPKCPSLLVFVFVFPILLFLSQLSMCLCISII